MSEKTKKIAEDVQARIREAAYLMWESAGRQHGMAVDYWLAAEHHVLSTVEAAASLMRPKARQTSEDKHEASASTPAKPPQAAPAEPPSKPEPKPEPKSAAPAPQQREPTPTASAAPKPAAAPVQTPSTPEPAAAKSLADIDIREIEGIGPAYAKKLAAAGITSPEQLLKACATANARDKAAEKSGISLKQLVRWATMADLMRIGGVDGNMAELLEAAGVTAVQDLTNHSPGDLAKSLRSINAAKNLSGETPSPKALTGLIEQAKALEARLTL